MVNSLFDITGKKAIVTGGTRGLGKGMAEGLMESGAEVAIIGTSDKVYQVADEFKARGFVCYGVKADLSDRDQCNEAFNKCVELLGDLDILVPAHGIQRRHPSNEFPDKDWDDVINTNLNSVFWLSRAASNIFKAKGYGKIIMIVHVLLVWRQDRARLLRCKGRRDAAVQGLQQRPAAVRHQRQRHRSGLHGHRNERGPDRPEEPQVHPAALRRADPAHSRSPLGHP